MITLTSREYRYLDFLDESPYWLCEIDVDGFSIIISVPEKEGETDGDALVYINKTQDEGKLLALAKRNFISKHKIPIDDPDSIIHFDSNIRRTKILNTDLEARIAKNETDIADLQATITP